MLGVAFVTGTLIFTDTLHNTFDQLFGGVYGKISVQVREPSPVTDQFGDKSFIPMPVSILPQVASLPGVAASEGSVSGFAQLVDKHDKAITTNGAPDHRRQLRARSRRSPASPWPPARPPMGPVRS